MPLSPIHTFSQALLSTAKAKDAEYGAAQSLHPSFIHSVGVGGWVCERVKTIKRQTTIKMRFPIQSDFTVKMSFT